MARKPKEPKSIDDVRAESARKRAAPTDLRDEDNDREISDVIPNGGVTVKQFEKAVQHVDKADAAMAKYRGDKSAALKEFEDAGGKKKELKLARSIDNMGPEGARDFMRTVNAYLTQLGTFSQIDLFEKQNGAESTVDVKSPDAPVTGFAAQGVSTSGPAAPVKVSEDDEWDSAAPKAEEKSIGQQQAEAYAAASH